MLASSFRQAFDSLPMGDVISFSYWRAIFGMALLAFYTGGAIPAGFGLPAGIGDVVVTLVMIVLLTVGERLGRIPVPPLLLWNTLGLLDLINAQFLVVTVLRPWGAATGNAVGNATLALFVVPLFIAMHLHTYARVYRDFARNRKIPVGSSGRQIKEEGAA